ncbi:MAG: hypothetical protein ACI8PD_000083, partial [Nitrospinales bacterium]
DDNIFHNLQYSFVLAPTNQSTWIFFAHNKDN